MNYQTEIEGQFIDLPDFSFAINDKLEAAKNRQGKLREVCQAKYNFISELIGKDKTEELIGKFESCDPNKVQIVFNNIADSYGEPVYAEALKQVAEKVDNAGLDKLSNLTDTLDKISSLSNKTANNR